MTTGDVFEKYWCASKHVICPFATINHFCKLTACINRYKRKERRMNDLISRQAAIDAINSHFGFNIEEEYGSAVQEVINGLPSAQPEIVRCKECKYDHTCTHVMVRQSSCGGNIYCPVTYCSEGKRREE